MRIERFKAKVLEALEEPDQDFFRDLVGDMITEDGTDALDIAAALARMAQGESPLRAAKPAKRDGRASEVEWDESQGTQGSPRGRSRDNFGDDRAPRRERRENKGPEQGMERYKIQVGHNHGVGPSSIVGAICNEAGLEGRHIGRIEIYPEFSTVDLPEGMPAEVFETLQHARVQNVPMRLSKDRGPSHSGGYGGGHGGGGGGGFGGKPRHGGRSGGGFRPGGGFGGRPHHGGKKPKGKGGHVRYTGE
jgi:ATP-dependent RNA helicase DeaD